ncbi:thiol:disulfide interchange protein DsbG [Onishia niordana]|jgi:thiol:disulfide interchange protein DsbG|uniref:thiol:disulfide interchange protein DsbG n=1 Tax=Onishia niordana TaxID=2508711 RepID=UPI0010A0471E|nr:thiol:disulfide interchange protein DsbG [Halomonas niordiana]|tara:strand:+ start:6191 stop:7021 length:831 start_codon:yes stop_codon:yes gene_type:complete
MKKIIYSTYCLVIVGLFGLITLPALAKETGDDSLEGHQAISAADTGAPLPASITTLLDQGLKFHGTFNAPDDIQGYALSYDNEPVAAYIPSTSDHAIIGTLIDPQGNAVMENQLQALVLEPMLEATWSAFEDTRFIPEGDDDASHIVYTLTDPNCPYCNALWKSSRPLIDQGELQLRHVLVGVLSEGSLRKAAAILESNAPTKALETHELNFRNGGISPVVPSEESRALLRRHAQLMREAGATGTPTSYYRDDEGNVQRINGAVSTDRLRDILGVE